jgi:uncharacterized protein YlxW (UPF0749 family)
MRVAAIAFIILILIVIAGYFAYQYQKDQATAAQMTQQINDLNAHLQKLQGENNDLQDHLAKVQEEDNNLKAYNDILEKALATAKLTGKVPQVMPYPPK